MKKCPFDIFFFSLFFLEIKSSIVEIVFTCINGGKNKNGSTIELQDFNALKNPLDIQKISKNLPSLV